jgi:hypothetical protein
MRAGGIACKTGASGTASFSNGNLAGGLNGVAELTGAGDITTANIAYIIVAQAALSGAGVTTADIKGLVGMDATLLGSGDILTTLIGLVGISDFLGGLGDCSAHITGILQAAADVVSDSSLAANLAGALSAQAALTGECDLSSMTLESVWNMVADMLASGDFGGEPHGHMEANAALEGTSSLVDAMRADATISADISASGDVLTPGSIADAVWRAISAAYDGAGSMAELLQNAATIANQEIINQGVKKASLLIPHTEDLP